MCRGEQPQVPSSHGGILLSRDVVGPFSMIIREHWFCRPSLVMNIVLIAHATPLGRSQIHAPRTSSKNHRCQAVTLASGATQYRQYSCNTASPASGLVTTRYNCSDCSGTPLFTITSSLIACGQVRASMRKFFLRQTCCFLCVHITLHMSAVASNAILIDSFDLARVRAL